MRITMLMKVSRSRLTVIKVSPAHRFCLGPLGHDPAVESPVLLGRSFPRISRPQRFSASSGCPSG